MLTPWRATFPSQLKHVILALPLKWLTGQGLLYFWWQETTRLRTTERQRMSSNCAKGMCTIVVCASSSWNRWWLRVSPVQPSLTQDLLFSLLHQSQHNSSAPQRADDPPSLMLFQFRELILVQTSHSLRLSWRGSPKPFSVTNLFSIRLDTSVLHWMLMIAGSPLASSPKRKKILLTLTGL